MNITPDVFAEFVESVRLFRTDNPMYNEVRQLICHEYGRCVWQAIKGYIEATSCDADRIWEQLGKYPARHIAKIAGGGNSALVYTSGDKVIKMFYAPMSDRERRFYEYCMRNKHRFLPRVYRIGLNYVVMERLETFTSECRRYDRVTFHEGFPVMYRVVQDMKPYTGPDHDIYGWNIEVSQILAGLGMYYPGDIRLANLGERPGTKEIVCFDV